MGPLLFILYINDIPNTSKLTRPLFFADDTSILYSHLDPIRLESVLNDELCNLDVWMKCNMLSVNVKKTNYNFKSRQKKLDKSFSLHFGNQSLKQVNETKLMSILHGNLIILVLYVNKSLSQLV